MERTVRQSDWAQTRPLSCERTRPALLVEAQGWSVPVSLIASTPSGGGRGKQALARAPWRGAPRARRVCGAPAPAGEADDRKSWGVAFFGSVRSGESACATPSQGAVL